MRTPINNRGRPIFRPTIRRPKVGPTTFMVSFAGLSTDIPTRKDQLRTAYQRLWASTFRQMHHGVDHPSALRVTVQMNANTVDFPADILINMPTGAAVSAQRAFDGYYADPLLAQRPIYGFLDYEPRETYSTVALDPVNFGFAAAERADGKAALQYLADLQKDTVVPYEAARNFTMRYGIYWMGTTGQNISGTTISEWYANAAAGVLDPFDWIAQPMYAWVDDDADVLANRYAGYYNAAQGTSASAVLNGFSPYTVIPLFRVRENSTPGVAALSTNQQKAIARFLVNANVPFACFWIQVDANDHLYYDSFDGIWAEYLSLVNT